MKRIRVLALLLPLLLDGQAIQTPPPAGTPGRYPCFDPVTQTQTWCYPAGTPPPTGEVPPPIPWATMTAATWATITAVTWATVTQ